jgi:hypothetical protein
MMGDSIRAAAGQKIELTAHVAASQGSILKFTLDGHLDPALPLARISTSDQRSEFDWVSDGRRHCLRADVVTPDGKLQILGNPVYFNYSAAARN